MSQDLTTTLMRITSSLSRQPWNKAKWLFRRDETELSTSIFLVDNGNTVTAILSFWGNGAVLSFNWLEWGGTRRVEIVFEDNGDGAQIVRVSVPVRRGFYGYENGDEFSQYLANPVTAVIVDSGMLEEIKAARTFV